jgi:hypothetical protein
MMKGFIWRSPEQVVVQPMIGVTRRFATLCGALEATMAEKTA